MSIKPKILQNLISGMRKAYFGGQNAMEFAKSYLGDSGFGNNPISTLIANDLQAGTYV